MTATILPQKWMEEIVKEFNSLPPLVNSGKIVLTFEINCGPGGTVNDVDFKKFIQRKWRP